MPRSTTALPESPNLAPDPRVFPDIASAQEPARSLYVLASRALRGDNPREAEAIDRDFLAVLKAQLEADGPSLARLLAGAPSTDVARYLWRALDAAWREATRAHGSALGVTMFALPLVVVAGRDGAGNGGVLPGIVADPAKVALILRDHEALAGNRTFALSSALVAADAIDIVRLPEIMAWCRLPDPLAAGTLSPLDSLPPAPMEFHAGREAVHLRFLPGIALAKPGADLTADATVRKWGIPLARELVAQMRAGDASVLVLPRAARRLMPAVAEGRVAQREVAAQIFASNAIRKFRATVGEPTAVISSHRAPDAPGGGELRLSLSSPFEPRDAEGFRCPLYPLDRAGDVVAMLVQLLRDCRVTDIRTLAGVHADRADATGLPLLFKPESISDAARFQVH
jgi:hypothetical protein